MRYVFVLSKENLSIAKEEAAALLEVKKFYLIKNILITETPDKNKKIISPLAKRLAYTNSIYALLFESDYSNFLKNMEDFDWNLVYKDDFCIRTSIIDSIIKNSLKNKETMSKNQNQYSIKNKTINNKTIINKNKTITQNSIKDNVMSDKKNKDNIYSEKELASYVWRKVKYPRVNLDNPKTHIEIFFTRNKAYCCLLVKKLKHSFAERKSHLRPKPSPISLHPRLARAMVNLTGAKEGEIILDPFCGSGGILIEAGLMGMKAIGYDINKKMVWKSMVNLRHYKIKNYTLGIKDFFNIKRKYKYIVSDLPYGLNTNIMSNIRVTKSNRKEMKAYLEKFYHKIIKKLEKILLKRAVVIFPSYFGYKPFIKKSRLKLINEFESYVHGNLTRKIVVLER